ncbi:hypothetical protein NEOLEDRAFT_1146685 [Neolentinus lepideus HHB14362 ss-1]|uniref:FAD-binding PCMH-type domain-containing protein n=1 Tax=Neolentinus lepideus HHB14362 ss-1 TaxID=1314782 RepID=A0A165TTA9_9AGAM|nr:hypothetical protein NEOLEDRAFT_1146685 [Neolentinus lepideus HHB14362 ss-1]
MQDGVGSWYEELYESVRGQVYKQGETSFQTRSQIFNGNVTCSARAVTCPLDAQDVSTILKICTKHSLSPSIKAGGYGTAGWAVNGDIIVDLSNLLDMHIAAPLSRPDDISSLPENWKNYTSIPDMPVRSSKGKSSVEAPSNSLKRQREEDVDGDKYENPARRQRNYDHASPALATFLKGPALPPDPLGEEPRRFPQDIRLEQLYNLHPDICGVPHISGGHGGPEAPAMDSRQLSKESSASGTSMTSSQSGSSMFASSSGGTSLTTPDVDGGQTSGTPFGYMATGSDNAQGVSGSFSAPVGYRLPFNMDASGLGIPGAWPLSAVGTTSAVSPLTGVPSAAADPFGYMDAGSAPSGSTLFSGLGSTASLWTPPPSASSSGLNVLIPSSSYVPTQDPALSSPLHRAAEITHLAHAIPIHSHAYVTFGAGVLQKDLDAFTHRNPLEGRSVNGMPVTVPYHVPSAAHPVGSSIMILGGFGFLSRLHGLSVDNVVEMEVVLADGTIVIASQDSHPDLWWALRGAGPAFGVITRYKVKAYPVPVVFAGNLIYRFHRATAPSLIRHFRDCIKSAPRELYANVLLTAGPANQDSLVVIQFCFVGPREKGIEFLQAIESWEGETCLLNEVSEKAFVAQQDSVAQVLRAKAGRNWFIRSALISSLPDEIINKTVMQFADTPIGCTWLFELAGGAITDHEDACIPKSRREATWTVASLHQWDLEIDDPRCRVSAENWINKTLGPVAVGGSFPSFLGRHEPAARTISCYGDSWARLAELKQKYDPQNVFRNTLWPLGEEGTHIEPEMHEPPSPVIGPIMGHTLRGS